MPTFRGPRPQDFFGPEDWDGGEVAEDMALLELRQRVWDHGWSLLTWWQRLLYHVSIFDGVEVDFDVVLAGLPQDYGVYQDGVRLAGPDY